LCAVNVGLMVYGAVQIKQIQDAIGVLHIQASVPYIWDQIKAELIAIPLVIFLGTIMMSLVAWKLYDEFSWTIYKSISADLKMKRRFLTYQIFIAVLKFDFLFFLGFVIQFVVVVEVGQDAEFWVTVAAIPLTIILLIMAAVWTRQENKIGMGVFIFFCFGGLAYYIFKLVRIWTEPKYQEYEAAQKPLTIFAVVSILLIKGTIVIAIQCIRNFGKGLKPIIAKRRLIEHEDEKGYTNEMPSISSHISGQVPSRMVIE